MDESRSSHRDAPEASTRPRRLVLPVFLAASVIYLEILLRAVTDAPFVNEGLLYAVLFAVAAALVVHLVAGLVTGPWRRIVVGVSLGALTVVFASQLIYYEFFTTFYSVFSVMNGGQATQFVGDVLIELRENALWLLLLALPLILFLVLSTRIAPGRSRATSLDRGVSATFMLGSFALAVAALNLGDREQAGA